MRCRICGQMFYIKRGILDLFNTKEEYICNRCYKKYPINLSYEAIQLDRYKAVIISMFSKRYKLDYNLFYKEYSKVFIANFKRKGFKTFFIDFINLNDYTLEIIDGITKLVNCDIIIVCLNSKVT